MSVSFTTIFRCSECGEEVETAVLPMFDNPIGNLVVDPRPMNAHALEEHGTGAPVEPPTPEMPPADVGYDSATPGTLYVPGPDQPDPTIGEPLPDPEEDPSA